MRLFYTAFLSLIFISSISSQEIQFAPVQGNPVLRSHAAKKQLEREAYLEQNYKLDFNEDGAEKDGLNGCPPDLPFDKFIVETGKSISIELDTFGLAVDSTPPTLTLISSPPLLYGVATLADSIITLNFKADALTPDFATDTVFIRYQQGGGVVDTTLELAIDIRRNDKIIITASGHP